MTVIYALQAALIVAVGVLAIERVRWLWFRAPVGHAFFTAFERVCQSGDLREAAALCERLADTGASRVARAGLAAGSRAVEAMEEELLEVKAESLRRLRTLRASATLASTLGLLGAIVSLVRGFSGQGLLALQSGLAERTALNQALLIMSIGVATSAVCFSLFGLLRGSALEVLSQASRAARAVEAAAP